MDSHYKIDFVAKNDGNMYLYKLKDKGVAFG